MGLDTANKRTKFAIDYIIKKERLSNVKLAEMMESSPGAINSYRRMITTPNIDFISKFCELFKFSLLWFVQGMGWPFADAWKTHPDSKGPTPIPPPPDIPGLFGPEADAPFVPSNNVMYINPASRILNEAIAEAGADLNDAQKAALLKIIQEEIDNAAFKAATKAKEIINVFKKDG